MRTARGLEASRWTSFGRVTAALLALVAMVAWALAPNAAGAATSRSARTVGIAQDAKLGTILVAGDTV